MLGWTLVTSLTQMPMVSWGDGWGSRLRGPGGSVLQLSDDSQTMQQLDLAKLTLTKSKKGLKTLLSKELKIAANHASPREQ